MELVVSSGLKTVIEGIYKTVTVLSVLVPVSHIVCHD